MNNHWYSCGLNFECVGCGNCCAGPQEGYIWISKREIEFLAGHLGTTVEAVKQKYLKRYGLRYSIKEDSATRDCIFLTRGKGGCRGCAVYSVRPNQCRTENLISQLKTGVNAMKLPVDNLVSNWAYRVMTSLAWNLKAWYALLLPVSNRWKDTHERQKQKVLRMEFKTFRKYFVAVPCQIIKTGRRFLYRLLGWNEYLDVFFRVLDSFCRPLRC